jgi:hypothetical protein
MRRYNAAEAIVFPTSGKYRGHEQLLNSAVLMRSARIRELPGPRKLARSGAATLEVQYLSLSEHGDTVRRVAHAYVV